MLQAHWVSRSAYLDGLQHTLVPQLLDHRPSIKQSGHFLHVGLDAPHKMRCREANSLHEIVQLIKELRRHGILLCFFDTPSAGRVADGFLSTKGSF